MRVLDERALLEWLDPSRDGAYAEIAEKIRSGAFSLENYELDKEYWLKGYMALAATAIRMHKALEKAERFIDRILKFYGQGLMVANWHMNGDAEPWDNFFDESMDGDELEVIRAALKGCETEEKESFREALEDTFRDIDFHLDGQSSLQFRLVISEFQRMDEVNKWLMKVDKERNEDFQLHASNLVKAEQEMKKMRKLLSCASYIMSFHAGRCPTDIYRNFSGSEEHLAMYRTVMDWLKPYDSYFNYAEYEQMKDGQHGTDRNHAATVQRVDAPGQVHERDLQDGEEAGGDRERIPPRAGEANDDPAGRGDAGDADS